MGAMILTEVKDGVGMVTLNRPARLNALTRDLMLDLARALDGLAADDAVRVVCLTGAGRAFCAGQDLTERDPRAHPDPFDLEALQVELFHPVLRLIATMQKPVVARVNGLAAGAGASLALACDIVIAAQGARFIQSFSKVGLSVDAGGGWALVRALGPARARALLMLGEALGADEAAAAGLIWRAAPDAALDAEIAALTARLLATPRGALRGIKRAVAAATEAEDFDAYLAAEAALQGEAGRDPDYAEGVLAFLEKRAPKFR
ncbi:2-(1,2-epoxy-1,2-dihydrophenyl)acetyl-CoA isomerase [Roseovarius spongiae]|uniref:2-(1,2-epoxy-1,2-dihydrophenyl)acetyl-CoA isomerase n=1 Tax=Roseovarius spongiae TaxID=2320272 RepID=A0A3A8B079_9RHOB|nr:enoyl-CoA hydratase-related protein [Roseovarius spongiae]RKF16820.1 2-(1,2-epoxy-1,2-dihydrophenyl)acetyl-CoA isomerase [Roseovarius spongiae]